MQAVNSDRLMSSLVVNWRFAQIDQLDADTVDYTSCGVQVELAGIYRVSSFGWQQINVDGVKIDLDTLAS